MKKLLSFLLALCLLLSCSISALACTEWCGGPFFDTGTPTEEELALEAIQRINKDGDSIIGKRAVVQHYGNIRIEPSKYASILGKSVQGDEYLIVGYQIVNNAVWLHIVYGNDLAWISASLAEISGEGAGGTGYPEIDIRYIGMRCRITVNSGRARLGAGSAYPIVEYVGYNDEFAILNVDYANDGTLWFQIMKDGNRCWISSGIAKVEGYSY